MISNIQILGQGKKSFIERTNLCLSTQHLAISGSRYRYVAPHRVGGYLEYPAWYLLSFLGETQCWLLESVAYLEKPFLSLLQLLSKAPTLLFIYLRNNGADEAGFWERSPAVEYKTRWFREAFFLCIIGVHIKMQVQGEYNPNCSEPVLRLEGIWKFTTFSH